MLPTLRRAALVAGLVAGLVLVPIATPLAAAQTQPLPPPAAPCGSLGPPLCGLIDEFEQAMAPLEPLFAVGLPVLGELGSSLHQLQSTLEQLAAGTPAADVEDLVAQLRGVFTVIGGVAQPVLAPLQALGLGGLLSVITELQGALDAQLASGGPADAAATTSTPVSVPGSVVLPSSSFVGRVGGVGAPTIPAVPQGQALELPDLSLPDFGATVDEAIELAAAATPDLPTVEPTSPLNNTNVAAAAAAAVLVGGVVLTAGLLMSRTRTARRAA